MREGDTRAADTEGERAVSRRGRFAPKLSLVVGVLLVLVSAGSALSFQALAPGVQVNEDPAAGIDQSVGVSGEDPANADVVGGALTAGKVAVPWALFRQRESSHDQIFSRSFAGGAWTTRGAGTVGGRSSSSPSFSGSLNFDQGQDGEAPAIDFAGSGRTVPWATWYEDTTGTGFAHENVFASRFDNTGDANQGKWIFAGQGRGKGGGAVTVPSLNIHTDQDAENPSVAGGSAVDPTKPGPWVTWQETSTQNAKPQIFVSKPLGPGQDNCDGVSPLGVAEGPHVPAIGGFCWQQTGIARFGSPSKDPSLNVDPTREGIEPDIAFTGKQDSVPWVVWYETGPTGTAGLHPNDMVFAAKAVADESAEGGFHWVAVGSQLSATLDTTGANGFGGCGASASDEGQCSLNKDAEADAEDPRVAAGTMSPANATSPWVAWDEQANGVKQVFVSRLVGSGASAHFELVNDGQPISTGAGDSTRPDIAFSGDTPYVSWREDLGGGVSQAFVGHFVNAASPTFVLDESDVALTPAVQADVREPISSGCIATPFDSDGAACQGGALGTPFFLFTNGTSPLGLFADAYEPQAPVTKGASSVSSSSATVGGSVDPLGAAVNVSFQYGPTTAYGQTTAGQSSGVGNAATAFTAQLTGLPASTTIHYRMVASSDFGTFLGADQTLTTTAPSPILGPPGGLGPPVARILAPVGRARAVAKASGSSASVRVSCKGAAGASCRVLLELTVTETLVHHRLVALSARSRRRVHKLVVLGAASVTLRAGQTRLVRVTLNRTGKRLLRHRHALVVRLRAKQAGANGSFASIATKLLTFRSRRPRG